MPFHRKGLAYFWVLNDKCDADALLPQLDAFAADPGVMALCLHPRPGLLTPYGGADWFDFIKRICEEADRRDLQIWLYDEDPYPSGSAGGLILNENPQYTARGIRQYICDLKTQPDQSLFYFPMAPLIWCGLVGDDPDQFVDLTERVGTLRRRWEMTEQIDSRFFYPETPLYYTPRADTLDPELAIEIPDIPDGMRLVAYVAEPCEVGEWAPWGAVVDTLNPEATQKFIELTHEKYLASIGPMFGDRIEAIFTDEPKCMDSHAWTPGLFDLFEQRFGYDGRPYLGALFSDDDSDRARLMRLHYRELLGERFRTAWLEPVAAWCAEHKLKLVGHVSPEDEPVEQSAYVTNMLPIFKQFDLCGIDIIIPAVGDRRHPILSVGATCASSVAQQQNKDGVMTETGALTIGLTAAQYGRILLWQSVLGVTAPLVHCAHSSVRGPRAYEYPPNYGPNSDVWPGMAEVHQKLINVQNVTHDARQIAPVAVLWTIRSFNAQKALTDFQKDETGMRVSMIQTLAGCLDRQVGTHFIDEADLCNATLTGGTLTLGKARYTHILIPMSTVLHANTISKLKQLREAGVTIICTGDAPTQQQTDTALEPLDMSWCPQMSIHDAAASLPRLIDLEGDTTDIRCTAWVGNDAPSDAQPTRLLINLNDDPCEARFDEASQTLEPGEVYAV